MALAFHELWTRSSACGFLEMTARAFQELWTRSSASASLGTMFLAFQELWTRSSASGSRMANAKLPSPIHICDESVTCFQYNTNMRTNNLPLGTGAARLTPKTKTEKYIQRIVLTRDRLAFNWYTRGEGWIKVIHRIMELMWAGLYFNMLPRTKSQMHYYAPYGSISPESTCYYTEVRYTSHKFPLINAIQALNLVSPYI